MRNVLIGLSEVVDRLNDYIGRKTSWLTTVLMILICVDVLLRYLFSNTKTWVIELEWHLFGIIFLLGAAYTLLHDKHVRVDLFYERFSNKKKRWVNSIGMLLFLIPWCVVIIYYGFDYAANSFSFRQGSSQPNGLPARYIIKSFIALGFGLLLLQGISELIKNIYSQDRS